MQLLKSGPRPEGGPVDPKQLKWSTEQALQFDLTWAYVAAVAVILLGVVMWVAHIKWPPRHIRHQEAESENPTQRRRESEDRQANMRRLR